MAGFDNGPANPNEDVIIIHLGYNLTDEQFNRVQESVIAFMNARWPNLGISGLIVNDGKRIRNHKGRFVNCFYALFGQ